MIESAKQVNQRRLGWISTGVMVLFAFLITLPFAGQSVASMGHSSAKMATVIAPQGNLNLQIFADSRSHDQHNMTGSGEASVSNSGKLCASTGHVAHRAHICCFDGGSADRTIMRRKALSFEKIDLASWSKVPLGSKADTEQHILAIALQNTQSAAPQLVGLTGARAQFLHTQRLLT